MSIEHQSVGLPSLAQLCLPCPKMRRRNYMLKVSFGWLKPTWNTRVIHFDFIRWSSFSMDEKKRTPAAGSRYDETLSFRFVSFLSFRFVSSLPSHREHSPYDETIRNGRNGRIVRSHWFFPFRPVLFRSSRTFPARVHTATNPPPQQLIRVWH